MWRTAVIDESSIVVNQINAIDINEGVAFICFHALGHMATYQGHSSSFEPLTGFMATGSGVFHILGTDNLDKKPELFNQYSNLIDLVKDSKNLFSGKSQTYRSKICDLF